MMNSISVRTSTQTNIVKMMWRGEIRSEDICAGFQELDATLKNISDVVNVIVLVDQDAHIMVNNDELIGLSNDLNIMIRNWMIIGKNAKTNAVVSQLMKAYTHHTTHLSTGVLNSLLASLQSADQQKNPKH